MRINRQNYGKIVRWQPLKISLLNSSEDWKRKTSLSSMDQAKTSPCCERWCSCHVDWKQHIVKEGELKGHVYADCYNTSLAMGFYGGSADKESACNAGDLGLIPGLGRSPGEGNGYPLQYSGLENSMDCIVHGVAKSRTWVTFTTLPWCTDLLKPFSYITLMPMTEVGQEWFPFFYGLETNA